MAAHPAPSAETIYQLGIDIGSTTVKAVLLRGRRVVFSDYRRHNADVRGELLRLLRDIQRAHPKARVHAAVTGSGGFSVAKAMGATFVQEVIAGTEATRQLHPDVDVVIELGGEDAKITYLHPTPEQRMNGTCAVTSCGLRSAAASSPARVRSSVAISLTRPCLSMVTICFELGTP